MDGVVCQTDIFTNKCSSCNWNERSGCHIGLHSLRDPGIWWTAFGYKWVAVVAADKSHWNWFNDVQIRPYSYKLSPIYSCQGNAPKTTRSSSSPALSIVLCCRHGHPGRRQSSSSKNGWETVHISVWLLFNNDSTEYSSVQAVTFSRNK